MQSRRPPRRSRTTSAPLYAALANAICLAGCVETVGLGSECPPDALVCEPSAEDRPRPGPFAGIDASVGEPTPMQGDALTGSDPVPFPERDAGEAAIDVDASVAVPALANRSFELTQGQPGNVSSVNLFTAIAPWFACTTPVVGTTPLGAVRAERTIAQSAPSTDIVATDGQGFASIRYLLNVLQVPLAQTLGAPLKAGRPYAFAIDVRTPSKNANLSLQVRGANDCLGALGTPELLAEVPVSEGDWQRVCVAFTPARDHTMLMLQVSSNPQVTDDLLLFDNIREAADCPELR